MSPARVRKGETSICDARVALLGLCYLVAFEKPLCPQTPDPQKPAYTTLHSPASGHSQRQIAQAKSLLEAGAVEQAVVTLRDILRDDPDNGDAHLLLGSALALVPERSEALKELYRAVELQSSSALAYFSLGTAQARFGDSEAARHSFEKSLQLDPGFAEAHVSVAMILAQQHEWAAAREHLMESIRIDGNTVAAAHSHYLLAQVLTEQNEPEKALQELNTAISLRPNYPEALLAQGFIRKSQHNDAQAIKAFKKAMELSPDSFDSNHELGTAYLRAGDAAHAIEPLRKAAALRPDDRSTRYQLCIALQRAGRADEATACQQDLSKKINAGLTTAANELISTEANNAGVELEKRGNLTDALAKYREAVRLDPKVTVFRRNLALALCRLGDWNEGVVELREVLKEDPNDAQAMKALYIALENAHKGKSSGAAAAQSSPQPK